MLSMNNQQLYSKISQGFNWNALLYIIHKGAATLVIMVLYTVLHTNMFSIYGNISSITFLLLLWLDFGFHKTVPLFALQYAQTQTSMYIFIKQILLFKSIVLLLLTPCYLLSMHTMMNTLALHHEHLLLCISALFFLTEGIISAVRLIYHAYFLHSIYNKISAGTLLLELSISLCAIKVINDDYTLILALFLSKVIANCLLLTITWYKRYAIYQQHNTTYYNLSNTPTNLNKQFIIHAIVMYGNTNIKSLSERNFLLPLFTLTFGPATANMFKVANDGALFFYRIIIKTIGTLDTSLFSYALTTQQQNKTWQFAITKLTHKIGTLVIPLLGIIYVIYNNKWVIKYNFIICDMFLIITISLLIEILFSPFERILEVKKKYCLLAYAYMPYMMVMLFILFTKVMTYIGIVNTLLLIHGVRLVSTTLTTCIVYIKYKYAFPFLYIGILIGITIPLTYILQQITAHILFLLYT